MRLLSLNAYSMDAVRLVLGIRRSARAVQHAGPAGLPEGARRGGYLVGGGRSSPRLLMNILPSFFS